MSSKIARARRQLAIAVALGAGGAHAATITVTDNGDPGSASTCTLRQAIDSANNDSAGASTCVSGEAGNDTIVFTGNLVDATVTLSQGQLSIGTPVTISGNGQTLDAGGTSRIFYVHDGAALTAGNLTLTGGGDAATMRGGGIYASGGTLTLTNTTITQNVASYGAGVYAGAYSTATLVDCSVSGNTAGHSGGGLAIVNHGTLTLTNTIVSGNTATVLGGGVYAPTFNTITFTHSTISGNSAPTGAGAFTAHDGVTITDSTIAHNTATLNFGGLYAIYGTLTLTNTTVSGNSAGNFGGGLFAPRSTVTFTNATVAGNTATTSGGIGGQVGGTIAFTNTILADNPGGDCYNGAGTTTIVASHSLIADAGSACGVPAGGADGNLIGQDPLLGALTDNGGTTQTINLDAISPAINAGSVALAAAGGTALHFDQRGYGFPRTLDAKIDMGAFQHQGDRVFGDGVEAEP